MYTFKKIENPKNGGLYIVQQNDEDVAYLRISYGVVMLYPYVDGDVHWGVVLGSWIFDDLKKKELTKEEADKILGECPALIDEFLEELDEAEEPEDDTEHDSYYLFEKENPCDEDI